MEFKVGSLASLISGSKSPAAAKKSKLFQNVSEGKINIKFQAMHNSEKERGKIKATDEFSGSYVLSNAYRNKTKADTVEPESVKSSASYAVKRTEKKMRRKITLQNEDVKENRVARSIFVGNVPHSVTMKKLKRLFKKYGTVESVRLRCPPLADPRVPKKVAVIKRDFHPDRNSIHAFVTFHDSESAQKALVANGTIFEEHHIRVDMASGKTDYDQKKAVFLGNVPFAAEDDDLWKIFESCGKISSIRLVRDRTTGVGKGFAYINFESADSVELALKLDGEELNKRKLRVQRCVKKPKGKPHSGTENRNRELKKSFPKTERNEETNIAEEHENKGNVCNIFDSDKKPEIKHTEPSKEFSQFQGQKITGNKKLKKKKNKSELKKKALIIKLAPKSKVALKKVKKPALKIKSLAKMIKLKLSRK
ncbi:RNA-binding protein 34 [Zootermopsis nevadensis]|uniref:RNA-binding protein 34 n=1 Tax=Zootermopsis nevadensis TaxID=136037 RepID=A0A067QS82_ZOONE|nr:RNA-binding protein 34 [Zootermopsis nevadensis]XP_021939820.1 RNA-binding protein 34 [Zootermopsis nevadensis]XP_021939821.1 RNA-binding protein 34 [Zootermopsis nevadensis]KDR08159.1 RNA-binding protein 34 [Zootermopsis nevadensis]